MLGELVLGEAVLGEAVLGEGGAVVVEPPSPPPPPPPPPPPRRVGLTAPRPSLGLAIELEAADGTRYRWDSEARDPGDRPLGIDFKTRRMDGFADATVTLRRRIDRDYPDTEIYNSVVITGDDGWVAYEGIIVGEPRSVDEGHSITVQCTGWMSTAKYAKFSQIYVDRGLEGWGQISRERSAYLLATANYRLYPSEVGADATTRRSSVITRVQDNWVAPFAPASEAMYDSGPNNAIGAIYYTWRAEGGVGGGFWDSTIFVGSNDHFDSHLEPGTIVWRSANLGATAADKSGYFTAASAQRFAMVQLTFGQTPGGAAGATYGASWSDLTVYGDHGLSLIGADPKGVAASDVITHIIERYCPKLNAGGVQETTYPLPQVAFKDRVFPYDAMLEVNAAHLWDLAVWEHRTFHYGPVILVDHDWEVRLSDHGVTGDVPGDTVEDLANGIAVEYDDVATGRTEVLLPLDYPELQDPDIDHPATRHGFLVEGDLKLGLSTRDVALQMGRAALAERNQPKAAGALVIRGHARDRYGTWQPAYRIRAGDTISVMDHPNSRPRLVVETSWNNDSKTMTVALDSTLKRVDAILDRMNSAIAAANLS